MKGVAGMNDIIGILWFKDEFIYRKALALFSDCENMPATFEDWQTLVGRQREEIKRVGNIALRADFDPETFIAWCKSHVIQPNSHARTGFVEHVILEYRKTGTGTFLE
jgi:hypothetical protein